MPVSAGIYNALAQPIRSVADYAADFDQADLRKQGIARNALMMQEAQAAMADRERLRKQTELKQNALMAITNSGASPENVEAALLANPMLYAEGNQRREDRLKAGKTKAEIAAAEQKQKDDAYKLARTKLEHGVQWLQVAQTPQQAQQMYADGVRKGYWSMQDAQQQAQGIPQDPAQFDMWKRTQLAQILDASKLLPKVDTRNLGGTTDTFAVNPLTGVPTRTGSVQNTQSPDNKASVGAQYANAAAAREQAQATRDAARITARAGDETAIRKEFADLPEVKKYKNAIPAYQAIVKAAQTNNPQADINLIYGLAKLYDPDSVVREGEYDTIANSQSIPEWLKGQAQRLAGGGKLTAETKRQIIEQADIRIGAYKNEFDGAQKSYEQIVSRRGLAPENVFPAVGGQVAPATPTKAVKRTGKLNGRKVVEYTDGSIEYAD